MVHVLATIELHSGARTQFLGEFQQIVPAVRAEDGCLEYAAAVDVFTGLVAQIPLREHVVVVVEKWRDLPALVAHLAAPHMTAYRGRVRDLVVKTTLQVLEPAEPTA
jgi:quinol monooxygenase YgiN